MKRVQLTAEELNLAGDAEGGAFLGVLPARSKLAHVCCRCANTASIGQHRNDTQKKKTCLEGKLLQSDRQARERFVAGAGLGDDGEAGGRAIVIARGNLDASDGGRLVRRLGRRSGRKSALRKLRSSLATESQLAAPRQSRSADHGWRGPFVVN